LTGSVLAEGVVGASEHAGQSDVLCVGPRVRGALHHAGLGRVVCKGHRPRNRRVLVRTARDARQGKVVSVGVQILGTVEHASSSVVVCKLVRASGSAYGDTLTSKVAGPLPERTSVCTVVPYCCSDRAG
jgi:hypothetical protein